MKKIKRNRARELAQWIVAIRRAIVATEQEAVRETLLAMLGEAQRQFLAEQVR